MRRLLLTLLLVVSVCLSSAQTTGGAAKDKPAQESGFMSWIHDAWKTVQEQGGPAAEKVVRQWPKQFQAVKQQVADLSKKSHDKLVAMDLEQKRKLALELWRVRKSLDLMTLLRPDVLQSLTGLDTSALASLETQVQKLINSVQTAIGARGQRTGVYRSSRRSISCLLTPVLSRYNSTFKLL